MTLTWSLKNWPWLNKCGERYCMTILFSNWTQKDMLKEKRSARFTFLRFLVNPVLWLAVVRSHRCELHRRDVGQRRWEITKVVGWVTHGVFVGPTDLPRTGFNHRLTLVHTVSSHSFFHKKLFSLSTVSHKNHLKGSLKGFPVKTAKLEFQKKHCFLHW